MVVYTIVDDGVYTIVGRGVYTIVGDSGIYGTSDYGGMYKRYIQ